MSIGVIAISTNAKKEPAGSPFTPGSAYNGTSIDSTGRVVLGNDVGDIAAPAQLISDREIITEDLLNLFALILNAAITGITTRMDGSLIQLDGIANSSPAIIMNASGNLSSQQFQMNNSGNGDNNIILNTTGNNGNNLIAAIATAGGDSNFRAQTNGGGLAQMRIVSSPDSLEIFTLGAGHIQFQINQIITVGQIDTALFNWQVGPGLVADNGANFQISGNTTYRWFLQGQGAGAYNVDRDLDSAKLFTNSAAATFNLPNMAGANLRSGFILRLTIDNAAGATIQASAGQTIRFGALASSVGGTISSIVVGSYLEIILINSSTWVTGATTGTWILT